MPTLNNQLRMSALIQEGIFLKDTSMAIPQLDMKKTFFNAYENHLWSKNLITKYFPPRLMDRGTKNVYNQK